MQQQSGDCQEVIRQGDGYRLELRVVQGQARVRKVFSGKEFPARFQDEVLIVEKLGGKEGFPEFLGHGEDYYERSYVEGETLVSYADDLAINRYVSDVGILVRIVGNAHDQGIVLGDIKPENLVRNASGGITFIDFSLCSFWEKPKKIKGGSLAYMAPELLAGESATPQSDLYSLGVLLYELTAGRRPFAGGELAALVQQCWFEEARNPVAARPLWPEVWSVPILRLLARDPAQRPSSANDFLRLFNHLLGSSEKLIAESGKIAQWLHDRPDIADWKTRSTVMAETLLRQGGQDSNDLAARLLFAAGAEEKLAGILSLLSATARKYYQLLMLQRQGNDEAVEKLGAELLQEGDNRALNVLAGVYYRRGDLAKAKEYYARLVADFLRQGKFRDCPSVLVNLGHINLALHDEAHAQKMYQQALALAEITGEPRQEILAQLAQAYFLHQSGRWGRALNVGLRAIQMCAWFGLDEMAMTPRLNQCSLLLLLGERERAQDALLSLKEMTKDKGGVNEILWRNLAGDAERLVNNKTAALEHYQRAYELARSQGLQNEVRAALGNLIRLGEKVDISRYPELNLKRVYWRLMGELAAGQNESREELLKLLRENSELDMEEKILAHAALLRAAEKSGDVSDMKKQRETLMYLCNRIADGLDVNQAQKVMRYYWGDGIAQAKNSLMRALVELSTEVIASTRTEDVLKNILDKLLQITGAERGFIILKSTGGEARVAIARHIDRKRLGGAEDISWSIATRVMETARAVVTLDAPHDQNLELTRSMHVLKLRTIMCLPFVFRGESLGAIYLDSRQGASRIDVDWAEELVPIVAQMAVAIHHARYIEKQNDELSQVKNELGQLRSKLVQGENVGGLVFRSEVMRSCLALAARVATSMIPVLITGESGTGKERMARLVHDKSPRHAKNFVAINCGAIPDNLLESELFGYRKGAFTGADRDKKGLMAQADGGTLFLDEVGELPPALQVKLLRVLQEKEYSPLGSDSAVKVDFKLITATNRDLRAEVRAKRFREDLFFRIQGAEILIPPLRKRREDIFPLVSHFARTFCEKEKLEPKKIMPAVLARLEKHSWPGNVRELENVVYKLVVLSEGKKIEHLPFALEYADEKEGLDGGKVDVQNLIAPGKGLTRAKKEYEKGQIEQALRRFHGNVSHAAAYLKIARPRLSLLLGEHRIKKQEFK